MTSELTLYKKAGEFAARAKHALAEATTVEAVKSVRNWSHMAKAFAEQTKDRTLMADAWEFVFRSERKLGGLMAAQKETVGLAKNRPGPGRGKAGVKANPALLPTLADVGIDKNLANRARSFWKQSDEVFEAVVEELRVDILLATKKAESTLLRRKKQEGERGEYETRIIDGCTLDDLDRLADSGFRAGAIAMDPPWSFEVYSGKGKQRAADRYYDTADMDWLTKEFAPRVARLAADSSALFQWSVCPELPGALELIEACGFNYKTVGFVWVKTNADGQGLFTGMGYWSRANVEPCLLGTRGEPHRIGKDVHQVVMAPLGEHSEKPDEVYSRIERLVPGPYLELFGRRQREGWAVWGNEVPSSEFVAAAE